MTGPQDVLRDDQQGPASVAWSGSDIVLALVAGLVVAFAAGAAVVFAITALGLRPSRPAGLLLAGFDVYASLCLGAWWFCLRRRGASWPDMGLRAPGWSPLIAMVPLSVALLVLNGILLLLVSLFVGRIDNPQREVLAPGGVLTAEDFVWLLLLIAVIAPVGEELIFRGMLYRYLRARVGVALAVVLSAVLFAAAHVIPVLLVALFALGVALALVVERFESIVPAIVLHGLNNGISLMLLYTASSRA